MKAVKRQALTLPRPVCLSCRSWRAVSLHLEKCLMFPESADGAEGEETTLFCLRERVWGSLSPCPFLCG